MERLKAMYQLGNSEINQVIRATLYTNLDMIPLNKSASRQTAGERANDDEA